MIERQAIEAWGEFYAAVANAGAALLGLVFVGISIHLSARSLESGTRLLGVESVTNLLYPLLVALVMLLPVDPWVQGLCVLVLGMIGLPGIIIIAWKQTRPPRQEPRLVLAYRHFLPLAAVAIGMLGAIGLVVGWSIGLYAPALFVFLMFIVGTQNAWDLLLGTEHFGLSTWRKDHSGVSAESARGCPSDGDPDLQSASLRHDVATRPLATSGYDDPLS